MWSSASDACRMSVPSGTDISKGQILATVVLIEYLYHGFWKSCVGFLAEQGRSLCQGFFFCKDLLTHLLHLNFRVYGSEQILDDSQGPIAGLSADGFDMVIHSLVVCQPESTLVIGLPVGHDGVDRGKKGGIVLQPSLRSGDVRSSSVRTDGDELSQRFAASGNSDRLPTIGHTA